MYYHYMSFIPMNNLVQTKKMLLKKNIKCLLKMLYVFLLVIFKVSNIISSMKAPFACLASCMNFSIY